MMGEKLTLALPKGRVMEKGLAIFQRAGLKIVVADSSRALRYDAGDVILIEMRNRDIPTYVELGVADAGGVGKDVLSEMESRLFAPVDLGFAACRLSLIRKRGDIGDLYRVASKYPNLAAEYLSRIGSNAEVIKLAGNVELACITGLADAVVDIVETGSTLQDNDLVEIDVILRSSARFVVNRAALKLKADSLRPLIANLKMAVEDQCG